MKKTTYLLALSLALMACNTDNSAPNTSSSPTASPIASSGSNPDGGFQTQGYEVWLSDQTNTQGISSSSPTGSHGGQIVIYDSNDLNKTPPVNNPQIIDATTMFPNAAQTTGKEVVRLHGMLPSPDHRYMSVNFVGSGHLGIVDGEKKKAACLFKTTATSTGQQNHMTFWSPDGNYLLVGNQNGRIMERVDVKRSGDKVSAFVFNAAASLDLVGGSGRIEAQPLAVDMDDTDGISCSVEGQVADNQSTQTPAGQPKEAPEIRAKNAPICPIPSSDNTHIYTTLGGGGLFVIDYTSTPMAIVGEYDKSTVHAAGCGGAESKGFMHLNTGTSGPGISEFSVYRLPLDYPKAPAFNPPNTPAPLATFKDENNGKVAGQDLPEGGNRDAHGVAVTLGSTPYLHQMDRVQNKVEVFRMDEQAESMPRVGTYDLTTTDACKATLGAKGNNDPAPDLADISPMGNRIYVALRGPNPLSVSHAAEGSCPGLGIITLNADGSSGELTNVLETSSLNFDKSLNLSDPHAVIVRKKVN